VEDGKPEARANRPSRADTQPPIFDVLSQKKLSEVEASAPEFTVIFTEDKDGFYINGKKYSPDSGPMTRVRVGGYHHWRVVNKTREAHPFHIHQVHFLAYAKNEERRVSRNGLTR